ncbi:uncharacterized protein LOC122854814 isoform X3 [Aphidius gifuensis]|uniref:uncharacterized protein LOC122854814 isoform X3 n=1 Tax=Aphidius gifuensis TaxID=684658 RepID=UPI001CDD116C|nr:uncharacterized protein LOC122854814 isoform X3 [Aphidius gifuensis]
MRRKYLFWCCFNSGYSKMTKALLLFMIFTLCDIRAEESSTTLPSETTLGKLLRQARSEYYPSKYEADGSSVTSGAIGIRGEPEHRDAAYYESRCITCDPNKSAVADRMWRGKPRYDYYEDDIDERRHRYRYNDYADRPRNIGYEYERPRGGSTYDNDRPSNLPFDYDRMRGPSQDYDHYDTYGRIIPTRPLPYSDRYDMQSGRDYYNNDMRYERNYDRYSERGNGYDNSDQGYLTNVNRYDSYNSQRRPIDDPYMSRYDGYNYMKYDPYDKYEPYDRNSFRKPYDDRRDRYDRYERYPFRGGPNSRGYFNSGLWGPGGERGYPTSTLNYGGGYRDNNWREPGKEREPNSDHWKDLNRDREVGPYRPRDYYDGSTTQPGGPRGTSYRYDRPESSTKPDLPERDKPTNSPQTQDNKAYKD